MNKLHDKLSKCINKTDEVKSLLENKLKEYIKFEFYIEYQMGDGLVIGDDEEQNNAPLSCCIDHINKHGKLTYKAYRGMCI